MIRVSPIVRFAFVAFATLTIPMLAACGSKSDDAPADASPTPQAVQTVTARRGEVAPTLRISGVVAPYRQIGVSSALNEPLQEIRVREGDRVRAGQILAIQQTDDLQAQLDSANRVVGENQTRLAQQRLQSSVNLTSYDVDVRNAEAALAQARVTLAGALNDQRRYQSLEANGYIPQQTLQNQNVAVATDQAAVASAQSQLALAQKNAAAGGNGTATGIEAAQVLAAQQALDAAAASADQIRRQIARAVLLAPSDGTIVSTNANVGEYPSGRQLFTIDDDAVAYAILSASSNEALRIRGNERAVVASPDGAIHVLGNVEALLDQLAPGTTNFLVKVRMLQKATFRSGMPVVGTIDLAPVRGTIVPISAFTDATHGDVFVTANKKAHRLHVHDDAEDGRDAVVRGVPLGAHVVKDGTAGLSDGDPVKG
jgi:multidrug efflux pump subunit AcrA (membrane-fusion protein)